MASTDIKQQLNAYLHRLESLNPDLTTTELRHLHELARQAGQSEFASVASQAEQLIEQYRGSPVKVRGGEILAEYFQQLDNCARQLSEAGEISPANDGKRSFSTALVPVTERTALDMCKVLNRAVIPNQLAKAADAFRRRNEIVDSVIEIVFRVMWQLDRNLTVAWFIDYFRRHDGNHDPDIIRDALLVVLSDEQLPPDFLHWVEIWALDVNLLEYWPMVTRLADRLLCRYGLRAWQRREGKPRLTSLAHLYLLLEHRGRQESRLKQWLRNAMNELGNGVLRFMSLDAALDDDQQAWRKATLTSELRRLSALYQPVMLSANCILEQPDGAEQLAMAFMGLYGRSREQWDQAMIEFSIKIIRRTFMQDLKSGRTPVETIRNLTFGDQNAFQLACNELDLTSEQFDSISQREKVTLYLSTFYASFRQMQLIGAEIAKRYRRLMRILHEDYLCQMLTTEQMQELKTEDTIEKLATMAAEARKFLGRRRDIENSLEDMVAARMNFERYVRQERIKIFRQLTDEK